MPTPAASKSRRATTRRSSRADDCPLGQRPVSVSSMTPTSSRPRRAALEKAPSGDNSRRARRLVNRAAFGAPHKKVWPCVSLGDPLPCLVMVMKEAHMTTSTTTRRQFETLSQAADRTGLSVRTLRRRIAAGMLPAYRSGPRVLRVDPADVDRLMVRIPTA
ncbi:helix-turn-helix transcriptional regulator [Janibacter terrae]|uniref:helix-turn-helix transcriptional regulator n=2 Tax=Janibacter TaxID=53457 RepID=UPI0027D77984|nr:helix-turn-helix domain-containing protein [Janibacter terrae]